MYVKYHQTTDQKRQSVPTGDNEEQSEQNSTLTDHTYEELDVCTMQVEQRQLHISLSVSELESETSRDATQPHAVEIKSDTNQGNYDKL